MEAVLDLLILLYALLTDDDCEATEMARGKIVKAGVVCVLRCSLVYEILRRCSQI